MWKILEISRSFVEVVVFSIYKDVLFRNLIVNLNEPEGLMCKG
jgi:hypothetical protein